MNECIVNPCVNIYTVKRLHARQCIEIHVHVSHLDMLSFSPKVQLYLHLYLTIRFGRAQVHVHAR